MYKITCDGKTLHDDGLQGLRVLDGQLTLELGKSGALEFVIYPNHPYYDSVKPMIAIVEVYRNELLMFRGRVLRIKYGFHNEKKVSCEGELAFLYDSIIPPHAVSGDFSSYLGHVVELHNAQVEENKRFEVGSVTVADFFPFDVVEDYEFLTAYETLNKRMVEPSGGFLQVRHEYGTMYLDLLNAEMNISNVSGQKIRLGKNLLDIKKEIDGGEVFSVIIPLGAKLENSENRLDISADIGTYSIEYAPAVAAYGRITKTVVFDTITDSAQLYYTAQQYIADKFASVNTIEITAADLSEGNPELDSFNVGQWVDVVSYMHFNEQQTFLIRKMTIKISDPAGTKIEAGRVKQGLTDTFGNVVDDIGSLMAQIHNVAGSIGGAVAKAEAAATKAATAETKANSAASKADSAATKADSADTKATTATTTANNAATKANTAATTANNAVTTANSANTTATTALSTANTANTKATTATNTANSLSTRVQTLEGRPYITATGTTGIFSWKKYSDKTCEFFAKIPVTNYTITTALGGWFRGANIYEAKTYAYPFAMTEAPAVEMTFQTRNGLAAIAWVFSADATTAQSYLPQCYLIRPTTGSGIYGNINIVGRGKLS
jgi:hypothetical protein